MEESRRILDRNNWDLLAAISSHMGFETGLGGLGQRHDGGTYSNDSSPQAEPQPGPSSAAGSSSSPRTDNTLSRRAPPHHHPRPGNGGFFGWFWAMLSRPMDFVFRVLWDFIGFGLRFIRTDPRRG
jgi:hypothetical protein